VILQPKTKQVVYGKLVGDEPPVSQNLVYVEPAQINTEVVFVARVLSHVYMYHHTKQHIDLKYPECNPQLANPTR
jgi:hypothetical protein